MIGRGESSAQPITISGLLNWVHLIYLGLLPAAATFVLLANWPRPDWQRPLIFMGGVALVGVYQAVVFSYAATSERIGPLLVVILDGPLFAWLAGGTLADSFDFAVRAFLIDGLAIWLMIALLAITTNRPTTGQRWASMGFAGVAIITLLAISWPFLMSLWSEGLTTVGWLAAGLVEALIARYLLLKQDEPVQSVQQTAFFIVIMIILWIAAMMGGSIMGDIS